MNRKLLGFVFLLGSAAMLPLAKADEVNQQTTVRLSGSVEIPGGKVLPAGEYVFKLVDEPSTRNIVQIFDDNRHLVATLFTAPTFRSERTNDSVITVQERGENNAEAIGKWFFAGQDEGVEFLYLR